METLTELTTEFTTSTLPYGQLTTIPTYTGIVTIVTPLPTGKIEPNPILRNKSAIVGVIVAGVLVLVGGILVFLYVLRKRRQRVLWRTKSPDAPYTERSGRVLIRGHPLSTVSRPLAAQEWQPPLVSEIGDENEDEDEQFYSGQYEGPVTLPAVQEEEYGSIMAAVHNYGLVSHNESRSSSVVPRPVMGEADESGSQVEHLISFDEAHGINSPAECQIGEAKHGWVQADLSTPDPFADPEPDSLFSMMHSPGTPSIKYRPLSQSGASSLQVFSPISSLNHFSLGVNTKVSDRLRGGSNSALGLSTVDTAATLNPPSPHIDFDLSSCPSSLLNPPVRPKFTGTLTDLAFSSGPPVLPPIMPVASPGESVESYHPDGLLDPALLESKALQNEEGPRRDPSLESLVDYVDYTRPISSIIFHRPPTIDSCMEGIEEEGKNARDNMSGSPAVRAYHDKLLGTKQNF
ncbi:hypothetical protein J3R30DRAFT_3399495 [Lentinula aciculospora]|uniref:Uncharacterized protein n=1 Tax=Lentinula aciculospora TaxID=153920 RepID=A0A9W9DXQ9_9AGAR|nr:hypothetical protein J3R30DRAFT_3399495 [Lentinula aciculospora]